MSPSHRRINEFKKKQQSLDSNVSDVAVSGEAKTPDVHPAGDGKFENISDNGSEISDEGYRSLGLIQQANSQNKRISLHSQTSVEDAKLDDGKLDDAKLDDAKTSGE